jgi:hypothetical protein
MRSSLGMGLPVHFDDQGTIRTIKIHNVRPNAMLPPELQAMALPKSQGNPETLLGGRHV